MKKIFTASELVKALENGFLLEKDFYNKNSSFQYVYMRVVDAHLEGSSKRQILFEFQGWASNRITTGNVNGNPLLDILQHPEKWFISKFSKEDKPWAIKRKAESF